MVLSGKNLENALEHSEEDNQTDIPSDRHVWLENTSKYLFENRRIDMSDTNIKNLEKKVMEMNKSNGWSKVYQVKVKTCFVLTINFHVCMFEVKQ